MTVAETVHQDVTIWLITKPRVRLVGAQCVQKHGPEFTRCKRPQWGDGSGVRGGEGLCSRCWHAWNAWHGAYTTMQANPAAAKLDGTGISRLTFGPTLPEVGAHYPDTFPEGWL